MYGAEVPEPVFVNLEYVFFLFYRSVGRFFNFFFSSDFWGNIKILLTIIAILLIALILYCLVRLYEIKREQEKGKVAPLAPARETAAALGGATLIVPENETWAQIRRRGLSDDEGQWRLAIIEADIYLDQALQQKGYQGETLSDKLKQVDPVTIPSIQMAWEAHKVRNRIAHEGANYALTKPEARKTISYFEAVFKDLGIIEELA